MGEAGTLAPPVMGPEDINFQMSTFINLSGTMVALEGQDGTIYVGTIIPYCTLIEAELNTLAEEDKVGVQANTPVIKYSLRTSHIHGASRTATQLKPLTPQYCASFVKRAVHISVYYAEMVDALLAEIARLNSANQELTQQITQLGANGGNAAAAAAQVAQLTAANQQLQQQVVQLTEQLRVATQQVTTTSQSAQQQVAQLTASNQSLAQQVAALQQQVATAQPLAPSPQPRVMDMPTKIRDFVWSIPSTIPPGLPVVSHLQYCLQQYSITELSPPLQRRAAQCLRVAGDLSNACGLHPSQSETYGRLLDLLFDEVRSHCAISAGANPQKVNEALLGNLYPEEDAFGGKLNVLAMRAQQQHQQQRRRRSNSRGRSNACHACHEPGHFAANCPNEKARTAYEKAKSQASGFQQRGGRKY
jgi:hypothetical protein